MAGYNLKGSSKGTADFSPMPEDRYNYIIETAEARKTKAGDDMITVTLVVTEGKYKGRKVWSNFTFGPKAIKILIGLLRTLKSKILESDNVEPNQICAVLEGKYLSAWTEISTSPDGKSGNKVSKFQAIDNNNQTKKGLLD